MKKIILLSALVFTMLYSFCIAVSASQATGLTDGKVYKITNVGSGKCINVHYNFDENGVNVYQWSDDGSVEQTFKLEYDATYNSGNGGYRFRTKTSANGKYRVLDIVKSGGSVVSGCNLEIWAPTDAVAQYFEIIQVSSGKYKIVPVANTSVAVTAYGTGNGTSSGTTSTSTGNIYLSTYTGANNQLWTFTEISSPAETAYGNMGFSFPTATRTISSGYAKRYYDMKFHAGIDIPASSGTMIFSANTGTVVATIDEPDAENGRGFGVIVESSNNYVYGTTTKIRTMYIHMRESTPLAVGDNTTKGITQVGLVGNTGASGGNHLHFSIISDGTTGGSLTQARSLNPFYFYPNLTLSYSY